MQQGVSLAPQVEERRGVVKGLAEFSSVFLAGFQTHLIPYILALSILVSGYAAVKFGGGSAITPSFQAFGAKYLAMAATYVLLFLLLTKFIRMVFIERPEKQLLHLAQWGFSNLTDVRRLANGIHASLFIFILMSGFTMWKKIRLLSSAILPGT
jgi:hypothetical protein